MLVSADAGTPTEDGPISQPEASQYSAEDKSLTAALAQAYYEEYSGVGLIVLKDGAPRYCAGVFSNLSNWARISELIGNQSQVAGAEVVPADWIKAMGEPAPTNPNYGLHGWLDTHENGQRAYSQSSKATVPHSAPYLAEDAMVFDGFGGQRVYIVASARITITRTG